MDKKNFKNIYLRVFAGGIMAIILALFVVMAFFVTQGLHSDNTGIAKDGTLRLEDGMGLQSPVYLNGDWEVFYESPADASMGTASSEYRTFPLASIVNAKEKAAYRLKLSFPEIPNETLYLAIPTFEGQLDVYINGEKRSALSTEDGWMPSSTLQWIVPIDNLEPKNEWQTITIGADFSDRSITLFQRPVVLGTVSDLNTLTTFDGFIEVFAFGILILIIVNGCVFMLFRPEHSIISLITLFDAAIFARIFFSLKFTIGLIRGIFPGLVISDELARSAQLLFLMIAGIIGCVLSTKLYDPTGKISRWLALAAPICYGIIGVIFPFNMELFDKFGIGLLIGVYIFTFAVVFLQYIFVCWRTNRQRKYYLFQFISTCYIGLVVFCDIAFWTKYRDFSILLYAYVIFFIQHVIIRLYDNNLSYHDVEVLNQSLETTVQERTCELYRANQILSELSVRDPLTNIFNRLYFENTMEAAFTKRMKEPKNLHLCMFDLDFFKNVNDTYGHNVGDEVLKRAAQLVQSTVSEDVVLARIGGEEFVLLFDGYENDEVLRTVNLVRQTLEDNAKANPQHTTASFGIAAWKEGSTQKSLYKDADNALYDAKDSGRNRVVF